ncbi:unnamed protein product [Nesidiocoris tenuis]|uniref:Uncharacterized protein n=1 Tax=Nesidiocoris tenuis TaxID=355587 RepID=A0A6H5GTV6_9HEMI|nr:unnamed protein product [Nesidiocoris tenuis]
MMNHPTIKIKIKERTKFSLMVKMLLDITPQLCQLSTNLNIKPAAQLQQTTKWKKPLRQAEHDDYLAAFFFWFTLLRVLLKRSVLNYERKEPKRSVLDKTLPVPKLLTTARCLTESIRHVTLREGPAAHAHYALYEIEISACSEVSRNVVAMCRNTGRDRTQRPADKLRHHEDPSLGDQISAEFSRIAAGVKHRLRRQATCGTPNRECGQPLVPFNLQLRESDSGRLSVTRLPEDGLDAESATTLNELFERTLPTIFHPQPIRIEIRPDLHELVLSLNTRRNFLKKTVGELGSSQTSRFCVINLQEGGCGNHGVISTIIPQPVHYSGAIVFLHNGVIPFIERESVSRQETVTLENPSLTQLYWSQTSISTKCRGEENKRLMQLDPKRINPPFFRATLRNDYQIMTRTCLRLRSDALVRRYLLKTCSSTNGCPFIAASASR